MKWSELSARERDALVAEKVMGWSRISTPKAFGVTEEHLRAPGKPQKPNTVCEFITGTLVAPCLPGERIPRYSSEIAAAWEVVEKLVTRLYVFSFHSREGQWLASFGSHTMEGKSAVAAEAISIAALKACGVEIEY